MRNRQDLESILKASDLLKIISNPSRLAILCCLNSGEMSVGEIAQFLEIGQSALSQHLAKLRDTGLVTTRRDQQTIFYSLSNKDVTRIIKTLKRIYCAD